MPSRRKWRRWLWLACALALAGWIGRFVYLRLTLRPTPRTAYWEAKLAELDPPPPGAIPYKEAQRILLDHPFETGPGYTFRPEIPDEVRRRFRLPPAASAPAGQKRFRIDDALSGAWDDRRPVISTLNQVFASKAFHDSRRAVLAAARAGWGEPISFSRRSSDYYDPTWVSWLSVHARYSNAHQDPVSATEDWLAALGFYRQLNRTSEGRGTDRGKLYVLEDIDRQAREGVRIPQIRRIAEEVWRIEGPILRPQQILLFENCWIHDMLEKSYVTRGGDWLSVVDTTVSLFGAAPQGSRLWNLTSPLFHTYSDACGRLDSALAAFEACSDMVSANRVKVSEVQVGTLDGMPDWPVTESFRRGLIGYYRFRSALEAALAIAAIHEYRQRTGGYPDSLQQLVPDLLPRLPIDYADRNPLRYRRTTSNYIPRDITNLIGRIQNRTAGYVLYSIGPDGQDDGGKGGWDPRHGEFTGPDIVFTALPVRPAAKKGS